MSKLSLRIVAVFGVLMIPSSESFAQGTIFSSQAIYYGHPIPIGPPVPIGPPIVNQQGTFTVARVATYQSLRPVAPSAWQDIGPIRSAYVPTTFSNYPQIHPGSVSVQRPIFQPPTNYVHSQYGETVIQGQSATNFGLPSFPWSEQKVKELSFSEIKLLRIESDVARILKSMGLNNTSP